MENLTEEERRALRGSKFAPLPNPTRPPISQQPRQAHPGGPLTTNKAAALAKFLERKLQDPAALASLNPDLIELAVKNANESVNSGTSNCGRKVRHVITFNDPEDSSEVIVNNSQTEKHKKKRKKRKKNKKQKIGGDPGNVTVDAKRK